MNSILKWIMGKLQIVKFDDVLENMVERVGIKTFINILCKWLAKQAAKTANKVDDKLVIAFKSFLYDLFEIIE